MRLSYRRYNGALSFMARTNVKNFLPSLLLVAACALAPATHAADASTAVPRGARVAGGGQVKLAPSARAVQQWMASRPRVRDLRPKARGNFD